MATQLYASADPRRFGTLASSMFRLFAIMTLDDWWRVMVTQNDDWLFFLFLFAFIMLQNFVLLNLFVAVTVSNLDQQQRTYLEESKGKKVDPIEVWLDREALRMC